MCNLPDVFVSDSGFVCPIHAGFWVFLQKPLALSLGGMWFPIGFAAFSHGKTGSPARPGPSLGMWTVGKHWIKVAVIDNAIRKWDLQLSFVNYFELFWIDKKIQIKIINQIVKFVILSMRPVHFDWFDYFDFDFFHSEMDPWIHGGRSTPISYFPVLGDRHQPIGRVYIPIDLGDL